jgi:hypothetical protein
MDKASFEDLCFQVLSARLSGKELKKVDGAGGDGGVDLFLGELSGRPEVWQIKHFPNGIKRPQRRQVEKSLQRVLDKFNPRSWTLCVPVDLNVAAMNWFETLTKKHDVHMRIGLMQGSDIFRDLVYRPRIVETFFPGATLQEENIRALIAKEDGLTSDQLAARSHDVVSRWKQSIEEKDPRFTVRVTYPHETTFPDPRQVARELMREEGLIASLVDDKKRLDVFVRDRAALLQSPLTGHFTLRGTATEKLENAFLTGEPTEFSSDEIVEFRSPLEHLGLGDVHPDWLVVYPRPNLVGKRIHLRMAFRIADEVSAFEHIEFDTIRVGSMEVEFATVSQCLAFKLSFVIRPPDAGSFAFSLNWKGKDCRAVAKAYGLAVLLSRGCELEAFELDSGQRFFRTVISPVREIDLGRSAKFKDFFERIVCVSEAFGVQLPVEVPTAEDLTNLDILYHLARYGKADILCTEGTARFRLEKDGELAKNIQGLPDIQVPLNFLLVCPGTAVTLPLFGQQISSGPGSVFCRKAIISDLKEFKQSHTSAGQGQSVDFEARIPDGIEVHLTKIPRPSPPSETRNPGKVLTVGGIAVKMFV